MRWQYDMIDLKDATNSKHPHAEHIIPTPAVSGIANHDTSASYVLMPSMERCYAFH